MCVGLDVVVCEYLTPYVGVAVVGGMSSGACLPCRQWKLFVLAHRGGTCLTCGGEAGLSTVLVSQSQNGGPQHAVVQPSRGSLIDKIQASTSWLGP